jgi:hypothetical protein
MKRAQSLGILAVLFVVRLSMSFQFGSGPASMRLSITVAFSEGI